MGSVDDSRARPSGQPEIDWSVAHRAKSGEIESGDRYVIRRTTRRVLLAVIDGLGHGVEAARAARLAACTLQESDAEGALSLLVQRCHATLQGTRGAVMGLAAFGAGVNGMEWLGVGNVDGVVLHAHRAARPHAQRLFGRGGIVGLRLPPLLVSARPFAHGDTIILATDGIDADFLDSLTPGVSALEQASRILTEYGKETDDALVLVVRRLGTAL